MNCNMNFFELQQAADAAMSEALASAGFRRTDDGTWKRKRGDDLNVIWFQKHSANPSFCVNLGVHYSFIPKAGSTDVPEGDEIEQPECAILMRLTSDPSMKDQWWPIAASSVNQVVDLVCSRGLSIFDSYRLDGPIASIEVKDVEAGTANLLSSLTKVGGCLLLARIHERLGNRDKSVETATIGVKLAGMAVGPKKALKDILKRLGQPA